MKSNKRRAIPPALVLRNPICFLAFGFGSGLAPKAPGTFGTLAAVPFYLLASGLPLQAYLALVILAFVAGVWLCGRCEKIIGAEDHSGIVWDEFVGLFVTYIAAPVTPAYVVAGFCLFRLFDVWKPWPIAWFDRRVHGGLGIMLDDVLAGIYAALGLAVLRYGF
ncbi:phosphatidylglycerophosphatase A [Methylococcus sp. EFPC2]|uniref:phosphatidylglycerophosphatase A family protein n=1 Tax=Methylococcus sp. EFPC2 TaxID=2812648 RepID=UPI001967567A|nr:phosphatidylglycerophosphatase A [Methylococcus sp. EFPC2]QSA97460.1 phosphatidylglycerophosphatase A [Methylococcus sp. EFPC2]